MTRTALSEIRLDANVFDALTRRLTVVRSRRATLPVLAGSALGVLGATSALSAKKKPRKVTLCLDGQTVKARNKKKKKRLRRRGATRGACSPCLDLQPTVDLAVAIAAAAPGTTLRLCPGTFRLTGPLIAEQALTLIGAGTDQTILDGGDAVRVLQVGSVDTVTLQDLTITRGRAPEDVDRGGGILSQGELTLRGVAVTACSAGFGGGIFSQAGTLRIEAGSRLAGNSATTGGGIFSQLGSLTLAATSSVTGNTAGSGGGIFNQGTTTLLETGSTVRENDASTNGGGIFMQDGTVTLQSGSSVAENSASSVGGGGGIFRQGGQGRVILDPGSSVSGNTPDNCDPDQVACI